MENKYAAEVERYRRQTELMQQISQHYRDLIIAAAKLDDDGFITAKVKLTLALDTFQHKVFHR